MDSRKTGFKYEQLACEHLKNNGYKIIDTNYRIKQGEIDIIGIDENFICFIEVKYRKNNVSGFPEESVTLSKMKKICKVAEHYLYVNKKIYQYQMRFDVVAIDDKEIRLYKNAFSFV